MQTQHTTEAQLAAYFADLVNEMRTYSLFNEKTTFEEIGEYSDRKAILREVEKIVD